MYWKYSRRVVHTIKFQNFASCWLFFSPVGALQQMGDTWDKSKRSIWWQIWRKEKIFSHFTVTSWSSESRTDLQNGILTQTQDVESRSFMQPSPAESPWLGGKSTMRLVGCLPCTAELFNSSLTGCFEGLPVETLRRIDTFPQILTEDLSEKSSESYKAEKAQCWYSVRVWLTFILEEKITSTIWLSPAT